MNKRIFIIFIILITLMVSVSFGQSTTVFELNKRISDLEARVNFLEMAIKSNFTNSNSNSISSERINWRKLLAGMKDADVRVLLGEPLRIVRYSANLYKWEYSKESWHSNITFDASGVSSWDEPE